MTTPTPCPRCEKLCEELSEQVSDQIDPSVNVAWMRGSPDLPKYVQGLEAKCEAKDRAILNAAEKCSWCDGEGRDNDGESFIDKPCPKCKELWDALSENCGKDYVPRKELDAANKKLRIIQHRCACKYCGEPFDILKDRPENHACGGYEHRLVSREELSAAKAEVERLRKAMKEYEYATREVLSLLQSAEKGWLEAMDIVTPIRICEQAIDDATRILALKEDK